MGSLTCRIQYNFSFIELISKLSSHSCRRGENSLLHLLLLTVILNPKSSPIKKTQTQNPSLRFSLETMKGTTGQKRRTKQTKNKTPALARSTTAPDYVFLSDRFVFFPSLDSFQPKRCTKIWHDKRRENETIPIWNLIVALAENSESQ